VSLVEILKNWWVTPSRPQSPKPLPGPAFLMEVTLVTGERRTFRFEDHISSEKLFSDCKWRVVPAVVRAFNVMEGKNHLKWDEVGSIRIPRHQIVSYRIYQEGKSHE